MAELIIFHSIDFQRSSKDSVYLSHGAAFTRWVDIFNFER